MLELRGTVSGVSGADLHKLRLVPRLAENLPDNVEVVSSEIISELTDLNQVKIVVRNNSSRHSTTLTDETILADFHGSVDAISGCIDAMVGPSCTSSMIVNGVKTLGLLDSGSQVTVISESFYRKELQSLTLNKLDANLQVTGAGGQSVPYLGYIVSPISMPKDVVGTEAVVETIALICPDTPFSETVPVIVGTNTFKLFADHCKKVGGKHFCATLPVRCEVAFMYHDLQRDNQGKLGSVHLKDKETVIPAGEWVEVRGRTKGTFPTTRSVVLMHEPTESKLPEGLRVVATKLRSSDMGNLRVLVQNTGECDVVLKKKCVIADIFSIEVEYDIEHVISCLDNVDETCFPKNSASPTSSEAGLQQHTATELPPMEFKFGDKVPDEWKDRFSNRLQGFRDVFIQHEFDLGGTDATECEVEMEPGPPIRERPRPIPPADLEEVRQHIQGLLDAKIIEPSCSPYASPIVLVRKKSGSLRLCIDYRKVNKRIIADSYAIPKIEDLFLTLSGSKYFTSMDLSKAYYQVPMAPQARQISAFTTPIGVYQWTRMPMGMKNSASCFQRLMEQVFSDMNLTELIVFLDDILLHGETLEQLEDRTIAALERLRRFKLKLDPNKCIFGASEIRHLGFIISAEGIRPDPEKVQVLRSWPVPKTVKDVKSFLGFAGFYRRFVPQFAQIARPLHSVIAGYNPGRKGQKKTKMKDSGSVLTLSSDISHLWESVHQAAFEELIKILSEEPVVGIADKTKAFELHCDASGYGLGAVLYQEQSEGLKVIAYASRKLNNTEARYPAHKREFLALKWALTDKFHDYVSGCKVTVVTDNNPLCYVLKSAKLDATSHRWLAALAVYDLELRYKQGSAHIDADVLSRLPTGPTVSDDEYHRTVEKIDFLLDKAKKMDIRNADAETSTIIVQQQTLQAIYQAKGVSARVFSDCHFLDSEDSVSQETLNDGNVPVVEQVCRNPDRISDDILEPPESSNIRKISRAEWKKLQWADKNLAHVILSLQNSEKLRSTTAQNLGPELQVYAREQNKLVLQDGVVYRRTTDEHGQEVYQLVIPLSHREEAMRGVHDDLYHSHFDTAIRQARKRYFWPFMATDLKRRIDRCMRCKKSKARPQKAEMETISTTHPLELLCIDFLTIEVQGQKQNILVVMDHFTKYAQAFLTKDQTAKTVARTLWNDFFLVFGFPSRIHSDQGRDFESKLLREVCNIAGISKTRTTPYHPAGNPVERFNRTLIGMLRTLEEDQKKDWRKHLKTVLHAYNAIIHESTGFSPYYLFFGRHPKLPVDLAFGIEMNRGKESTRQYVQGLKQTLKDAYENARTQMEKCAGKNKIRYDASAYAADLEIGDKVLVKNVGHRLTSKIGDKWENGVYTVVRKAEDLPVYTVQLETGKGPLRTLHRNMLLPLGALSIERPLDHVQAVEKMKTRDELKSDTRRTEDQNNGSDIQGTVKLRIDAPEFFPSYNNGGDVVLDESVLDKESENIEVDTSGKSDKSSEETDGIEETEHLEAIGTELVEVEEEGSLRELELNSSVEVFELENATDTLLAEKTENPSEPSDTVMNLVDEVGDRTLPRRSTRVRKPVERLNLLHQRENEFVKLAKIKQRLDEVLNAEHLLSTSHLVHIALEELRNVCVQLMNPCHNRGLEFHID